MVLNKERMSVTLLKLWRERYVKTRPCKLKGERVMQSKISQLKCSIKVDGRKSHVTTNFCRTHVSIIPVVGVTSYTAHTTMNKQLRRNNWQPDFLQNESNQFV